MKKNKAGGKKRDHPHVNLRKDFGGEALGTGASRRFRTMRGCRAKSIDFVATARFFFGGGGLGGK